MSIIKKVNRNRRSLFKKAGLIGLGLAAVASMPGLVKGDWYQRDNAGNIRQTSGLVHGPASSNDAAIALFDGTTGKLLKQKYDIDGGGYIGRAAIGSSAIYPDYAYFSHIDCTAAGKYALLQSAVGATHLNAAIGQHIYFKINNAQIAHIDSSGLDVTSGVYMHAGYSGISGTFSFYHGNSEGKVSSMTKRGGITTVVSTYSGCC